MVDRSKGLAIAKDVLERLKNGNLRVRRGNYFHTNNHNIIYKRSAEDIQPDIDDIESKCQVCALGSLLLSKARLYDEIVYGQLKCACFENFARLLSDCFTDDEICKIEACFEVQAMWHHERILGRTQYENVARKVAVFSAGLNSPQILEKICQNIIANEGEFVL